MNLNSKEVRYFLSNPSNVGLECWTMQGLGMLRLKLPGAPNHRLHLWANENYYAGTSDVHTHPWDFSSQIFSGMIENVRFLEGTREPTHYTQTIVCGPSGCVKGEKRLTRLVPCPPEFYRAGDSYSMRRDEIHRSRPSDGAVTMITRVPNPGEDIARVFWPKSDEWTSAAARPATPDEVERICHLVLRRWSA